MKNKSIFMLFLLPLMGQSVTAMKNPLYPLNDEVIEVLNDEEALNEDVQGIEVQAENQNMQPDENREAAIQQAAQDLLNEYEQISGYLSQFISSELFLQQNSKDLEAALGKFLQVNKRINEFISQIDSEIFQRRPLQSLLAKLAQISHDFKISYGSNHLPRFWQRPQEIQNAMEDNRQAAELLAKYQDVKKRFPKEGDNVPSQESLIESLEEMDEIFMRISEFLEAAEKKYSKTQIEQMPQLQELNQLNQRWARNRQWKWWHSAAQMSHAYTNYNERNRFEQLKTRP